MGRLLEKGRHGAGPRRFISFDNNSFENKGRVFKHNAFALTVELHSVTCVK